MSDSSNWMHVARRDLRSARKLNDGEDCPNVCYLCQQAGEKAVKALIVRLGEPGGLPKKHDIDFLLNQIKGFLPAPIPRLIREAANDLNQYATATRYPSEEEIGQIQADLALAEAESIVGWVEEIMDLLPLSE